MRYSGGNKLHVFCIACHRLQNDVGTGDTRPYEYMPDVYAVYALTKLLL